MPKRVLIYVYTIIAIAIGVLFYMGLPESSNELIAVIVFSTMGLIFEALSVEAPFGRVTVSVSFVPVFAAVLSNGVRVGFWVGAISSLNWSELRGGKPLYRNLFNCAQIGLSAACSGFVLERLGGSVADMSVDSLIAIGLALMTYYVVNSVLPMTAVALSSRLKPVAVFKSMLGWSIPTYMATSPLAVLIALLETYVGYVAVALFLLPLLLARMSFKLYRDMKQNYIETIQSLAQAIDAKDHYTLGHSERVAYYAVEIARVMGLKQDRIDQLFFMALLHDIGKIGIKEHVLNKVGRLTVEERHDINKHAELGAAIVEKVSFLRDDAGSIRYHHEHFDGKGYPDGLVGEAIPVGARIIAAADSFDAMTSHRVYQPPRTASEAIAELKRCSGTQFDPKVVAAFEEVISERTDILEYAREAAATGFSSLAGLNGR